MKENWPSLVYALFAMAVVIVGFLWSIVADRFRHMALLKRRLVYLIGEREMTAIQVRELVISLNVGKDWIPLQWYYWTLRGMERDGILVTRYIYENPELRCGFPKVYYRLKGVPEKVKTTGASLAS